MTAICVREDFPVGLMLVSLVPVTKPSSLAQRMDSNAQEPTFVALAYLLRSASAVVLEVVVRIISTL